MVWSEPTLGVLKWEENHSSGDPPRGVKLHIWLPILEVLNQVCVCVCVRARTCMCAHTHMHSVMSNSL